MQGHQSSSAPTVGEQKLGHLSVGLEHQSSALGAATARPGRQVGFGHPQGSLAAAFVGAIP